MDLLVETFFNLAIMREAFPLLLRGVLTTLALCAVVIPLGFAGGRTDDWEPELVDWGPEAKVMGDERHGPGQGLLAAQPRIPGDKRDDKRHGDEHRKLAD